MSGECAPGNFCNTTTGKCEAIRAAASACGDWTSNEGLGQHTCSNRFSGAPPLFCKVVDNNFDDVPPAQWVCEGSLANGADCLNSAWCQSGVCSAGKCAGFINIYSANGCKAFVTP